MKVLGHLSTSESILSTPITMRVPADCLSEKCFFMHERMAVHLLVKNVNLAIMQGLVREAVCRPGKGIHP